MVIYLLCGVFLGALIGSWGTFWLTHLKVKGRAGAFFVPPNDCADLNERARTEEEKQAEDSMRRLEEGLYSVLFYDRKKTNKGSDNA